MTALLASTGCLSLVITGELSPLLMIPGIALIPGYYRFLRGYSPAPKWVITGLAAVTAGLVAFDTVAVSGDFFVAVAHMTIIFQAIKSFDLRGPWDNLQVYFMALLQLIITSELAVSMAVGGMFIVFLVIFVTAIVLSHFMKENALGKVRLLKPVAIIALVSFAATAIFFVAVPRARGSLWQRKSTTSIRSVGFSDKVELGSFGEVLEDSTILMRVSVSGPSLPLYWRGTSLDYFDGNSWSDTLRLKSRIDKIGGRFIIPHKESMQDETVQKIYLEPIDTDVVFALGEITAIESRGWFMYRDIGGSIYFPAKNDRRFSYTAYSAPGVSTGVRRRYMAYYLQLPGSMSRLSALAREVISEAVSDAEAARLIERHLKTNYSYSLRTSPPPEGVTPIEDFLFNTKAGYCEHFATSMVLMLRTLGIPARIVTGFSGGETNALGNYIIVRQRDAHSWVEAAIDGKWVRFDPTPPAPKGALSSIGLMFDSLKLNWYRYVVGFDSDDRSAILSSVTAPAFTLPDVAGFRLNVRPIHLIVLAAIVLSLGLRVLLRGLPQSRSFEVKAYMGLRKAVRKRGGALKLSSTPEEVLREARRLDMDVNSAARLINIYEGARFGGMELDVELKELCKKLLSAISSKKIIS